MDDRSSRWAFLQQPLAPLAGHLSVFSPDSVVGSTPELVLVVELPGGNTTPTALARIREAVVLLALVKRVDIWTWDYILPAHCGIHERKVADAKSGRYSTFRVALDGSTWRDKNLDQAADRLREFLTGDPSLNDSVFSVAIKKVVAIAGVGLADTSTLDIPVALDIGSFGRFGAASERWWPKMEELRDNYRSQRFPVSDVASKVGLDCAFVFGKFDLEFLAGEVDEDTLTLAEEIVTKNTGMGFSNVLIDPKFKNKGSHTPDHIRLLGGAVECVLCASRCSTAERAAKGLITVGRGQDPSVGYARVCSALANTQTANSVELTLGWTGGDPTTRAWVWKWVAFALFSDYAARQSSITSVKLSRAVMTEADVDAITELLSAPDPIGMLVQRDEAVSQWWGDLEIHKSRVLKRGAWVKLLPMDTREAFPPAVCSWTLSHAIHGVIVVDTVTSCPGLVRAIVPGYGLCKVSRVDLVQDADAPRSSGPVTNVELYYSGAAGVERAPERFLELIGAPLTRLHLSTWSESSIPIAAVVRCCPSLKCLRVDSGIFDVEEFLEAYRNSDLQIEEITWEVDVDSFSALTAELSDGDSRLAQTLKRLDCTWVDVDPAPGSVGINCIADMLERNCKLEYMRILLYYGEDPDTSIKALKQFDYELLPFASEPFPLCCRLAFLSVFSPRQRVGRDAKRRTRNFKVSKLSSLTMDRLVLSLIFEFAAPSAVRRVYVTTLH